MFTGLFPAGHGLHDNVTPPLPPPGGRPFPLLAEQFRDAGYSAAAFVSRAVLAPPTGIAGGFDVYDCPRADEEREETGGYVPGDQRIRAPLAWIERPPPGKPWFVWVHLFDPHLPYRPFPGDAVRAPSRETDAPEELYRGEVRRADAAFEALLRAAGKDTIVVLCSDHGEGLLDHKESTHGPLCYGSTIDAVLALRAKGLGPRVDTGLRSVADVAPTLRRLCGLPEIPGDGRDLAGPPHGTLVSESLLCHLVHGWGQCFSATDGEFTLVESGPRMELFDRRQDPGETAPIPLDHPAYEKLDRALERYRRGPAAVRDEEPFASVAPYAGLRRGDLRYLPRPENALLADPVAHAPRWLELVAAVPQLILMGATRRDPAPLRQALKLLDEFERRAGGTPWIDRHRATAHATLAQVTGDRSRLNDAIRSELAGIGRGYVERESIRAALTYITDASDADGLRTLLGLLRRHTLDPESAAEVGAATAALHIE
jgi:hypothetical protein